MTQNRTTDIKIEQYSELLISIDIDYITQLFLNLHNDSTMISTLLLRVTE